MQLKMHHILLDQSAKSLLYLEKSEANISYLRFQTHSRQSWHTATHWYSYLYVGTSYVLVDCDH